jgi:hypothetical protein
MIATGLVRPGSHKLVSAVLFVVGCLVTALVGCGGGQGRVRMPPNAQVFAATVQQRASFDLDCSIDDVTVQNIGGNSYGVTGCGKKVSYSCLCAWSSWGKCTQPMCSVDGARSAKTAPQ